jgi:hypothetical protein
LNSYEVEVPLLPTRCDERGYSRKILWSEFWDLYILSYKKECLREIHCSGSQAAVCSAHSIPELNFLLGTVKFVLRTCVMKQGTLMDCSRFQYMKENVPMAATEKNTICEV